MTANQKLLLAILSKTLNSNSQCEITCDNSTDWDELYRLSTTQGVLGIVWDGMQRPMCDKGVISQKFLSKSQKFQWAVNVERIEQTYCKQEEALGNLAKIYSEYGIKMMVLKGYGLSLCYPTPNHRPCGDIDIWLYGERKRADNLLRKRGFQISEDEHHHTVFSFNNIMVENHYDFINVHAHRSNIKIEKRLKELAYQSNEYIELNGQKIYVPNSDFNALFLLRHTAAHFAAAEIGLRHVVDWAMFVNRYHNQINWDSLISIAKENNMHNFLYCINAISIEYLGLSADNIPNFPRNKELEHRVLMDILQPEFGEMPPKSNVVKSMWFRYRRWWANRWKHKIVYREGLFSTFVIQIWSHLLKPKSLIK